MIGLTSTRRKRAVTARGVRSGPVLRIGLALCALGLLVLVGGAAWNLRAAWVQLQAARAIMGTGTPNAALLTRLPALHDHLANAATDLRQARGDLAPFDPLWRLAGHAPRARALASVPDLFDLAIALTSAGADTSAGLEPLATASTTPVPALVAMLAANREQFVAARGDLGRAAQVRATLDPTAFHGRLAPIGKLLDLEDRFLPLATSGLDGLTALPTLVGMDHPVSYLLVGQNEEERRATGGFVGTLGIIRLDRGEITQIDVRNSYDFSPSDRTPLPPPPPMAEWMGFGGWYIRDANWFPDFPTSAAWLEWFWKYYYGEQPDGVIAFDQNALQQLLTLTGPITLPDLGETITADNYRARMLYWLYQADSPTGARQYVRGAKTPFVRDLGVALFKQLLSVSPEKLGQFAPVLQQLLDEKDVILSFQNPSASQIAAQRGWDDHLDQLAPDYLLVDDTTVTYTKLAPFIREAVADQITLRADGSSQADVTVTYTNDYDAAVAHDTYPLEYLGEFWNPQKHKLDYLEGHYATFLRIYVPAAAHLVAFDGADEAPSVNQESGREVLGAHVDLPAAAQRVVHLTYALPAGTWSTDRPYQLLVQKQPGTPNFPLTVDLTLPPDDHLANASGASSTSAYWVTTLERDRAFQAPQVGNPTTSPLEN